MSKIFFTVFSLGLAMTPLVLLAALDVTLQTAEFLVNGITLTANGNTDSITVSDSNNLSVVLSPGGSVTITSANKNTLTVSPSTFLTKQTCDSSSSVTLSVSASASSAISVTVTPSSTSCNATSGGGGIVHSSIPTPIIIPQPLESAPVILKTASQEIFFARSLDFGMQGEDVKKLQTFLASDKSIYPEGIISGYFGSLTQKAVRAFQTKYKISSVGRVGPLTRVKLQEVFGTSSLTKSKTSETIIQPASSVSNQIQAVQEQIKTFQVKLLQEQIRTLQEKINALKK